MNDARTNVRHDLEDMVRASQRSRSLVQSLLETARRIDADEDRDARLKKMLCKACHYPSRLAGQAITCRRCAGCGSEEVYSSTDTCVLCRPCAVQSELCRRCGGDLHMRVRRRVWPNFYREPITA